MRKIAFANNEYYHIYNRGVDKREVFSCDLDYARFLDSLVEFNFVIPSGGLYEKYLQEKRTSNVHSRHLMSRNSKLVEIIAYCLNPNHYHLILKQIENKGIEKFMQKLGNGYSKYFNHKYKRSGVLFQGVFKSAHIDSNEYLLLLSAYVNANHEIHDYSEKDWLYSSLLDYTGKRDGKLCSKEMILGQFDSNFGEYEKYVKNNTDYFREKKELEEYILE